MATMSHTPAQRKAWHAGKRKGSEDKFDCFVRCYKARNFRGAETPPQLKRFIRYKERP